MLVSQRVVQQKSIFHSVLRLYSTASSPLQKTHLYDFHVKHKGNMVPFAGWYMPVLYKDKSIIEVHKHCRTNACLFDVGHMGQLKIFGNDRYKFIESLVPGNIIDLKPDQARLTQLTNDEGGILDDTVITKKDDHLYMVVNAGCAEQDIALLKAHLAKNPQWDVRMEILSEKNSLIALQGPKAAAVLQRFVPQFDLADIPFMYSKDLQVNGVTCRVTRCGYTGEDGFEISVPHEHIESFCTKLVEQPEVWLAGLGSRDTLRLEAGLCLMGHDMNGTITPVEAGLSFTIGKRRRDEGGFPGASKIIQQLKDGVSKLRIGVVVNGKGIPREGQKILDSQTKEEIGIITSGSIAPCLEDKPIGMGYVQTKYSQPGTKVTVDVRGKLFDATITAMPFVKTNYYRGKEGTKKQ